MRGLGLALLAAAVIAISIRWGSFVAGGPDSYCYVVQAQRWADVIRGRSGLLVPDPLAREAPWPDATSTFTPVGHTPSPVPGAISPICPAGLSIAMAPFVLLGGPRAAFAAVPLFGVALLLAAYAIGARFGTPVGMAAAVLTAASPVFLYQVVQPMSDVPAAALWLTAIACATGTRRRHALWSGLATSAAILVRPNLVPLGFAIGLFLLLRPERAWRHRLRAASAYAAASAPGCVAVALIQQTLFGSPVASGYGAFDALFVPAHVLPNAERYLTWLWQTHTPLVVLAPLALWLLPGALTVLLVGLFALNLGLYLPYIEFEDWSFLRFLLPTLPLVLILLAAVTDAIARRWMRVRDTRLVLAAAALALAALFVRQAADRSTFRLRQLEARFERAGLFVRNRLPPNALVITSWQSGSVRFYGERQTLVWNALDPAWLEPAMAFLRERGYEPYLLFERWEEPPFRQRFQGTPTGALDWPPAAEIAAQVRIYRPGDRQRYLEGLAPPTEYAR
jgi:hypothetical protein